MTGISLPLWTGLLQTHLQPSPSYFWAKFIAFLKTKQKQKQWSLLASPGLVYFTSTQVVYLNHSLLWNSLACEGTGDLSLTKKPSYPKLLGYCHQAICKSKCLERSRDQRKLSRLIFKINTDKTDNESWSMGTGFRGPIGQDEEQIEYLHLEQALSASWLPYVLLGAWVCCWPH